jgi:hypothetical protein
VAVDKPLTLRSVNGPQFTVIEGYQVPGTFNGDGAIRYVYLANGASLSGFTLTNVATRAEGYGSWEMCGGGVWSESLNVVLSSCVVTGNSAESEGGGVYYSTLNNCTLTRNSARWYCGAALDSTLNNCTVTANSGGGASGSTLNNCIVYFNTADDGANFDQSWCLLNYCCTAPLPTDGVGNITNAPLFVDDAAGDLRLQPNSPCINAGLNACAIGPANDHGIHPRAEAA